jgi:Na+/melibiose symporter-like transporter
MMMKTDDKSFQLDRKARSFSVSNVSIRDVPILLAAFLIVALPGVFLGWISKNDMSGAWQWIGSGFLLLIAAAVTVFSILKKQQVSLNCALSPEVEALAKDPAKLLLAIQRFQKEHPKVPIELAKRRIEEFQRTGL